jgi:hypothetical protein
MLTKDAAVYFVTLNAAGRRIKFDEVMGCSGKADVVDATSIELTPYPDPNKAQAALAFMCKHLAAACEGNEEARAAMIAGWSSMVTDGLKLEQQDAKTQFKILASIYGSGRLHSHMDKHGSLEFFDPPGWSAMLDEVLPLSKTRDECSRS